MNKQFITSFGGLISLENLLEAWREFLPGKRSRVDVQQYSLRLMGNIIALHRDLANEIYDHGGYEAFNISDPKPRNIHKASVRDRLLHHAICRELYPFFGKLFIADSFSCQLEKGTHRALQRFEEFARKVSKNNTRTCWILKCDVRKFFANVDHEVLISVLKSYIPNNDINALLENIINSFHVKPGIGLPLGNLTSQLFVNIYMNEFDQFAKHTLLAKYYIRYCDDFVILSENRKWLESLISKISDFLNEKLGLELHPQKVSISTLASGLDFLGWIHFPYHRIPRTTTKKRMLKHIKMSPITETLTSYQGLLKHGATEKLSKNILKEFYICQH